MRLTKLGIAILGVISLVNSVVAIQENKDDAIEAVFSTSDKSGLSPFVFKKHEDKFYLRMLPREFKDKIKANRKGFYCTLFDYSKFDLGESNDEAVHVVKYLALINERRLKEMRKDRFVDHNAITKEVVISLRKCPNSC